MMDGEDQSGGSWMPLPFAHSKWVSQLFGEIQMVVAQS